MTKAHAQHGKGLHHRSDLQGHICTAKLLMGLKKHNPRWAKALLEKYNK